MVLQGSHLERSLAELACQHPSWLAMRLWASAWPVASQQDSHQRHESPQDSQQLRRLCHGEIVSSTVCPLSFGCVPCIGRLCRGEIVSSTVCPLSLGCVPCICRLCH